MKEAVCRAGLWSKFVEEREKLRAKIGHRIDLWEKTYAQVMGIEEVPESPSDAADTSTLSEVVQAKVSAVRKADEAPECASQRPEKPRSGRRRSVAQVLSLKLQPLSAFKHAKANAITELEWVHNNLSVRDPDLDGCPSPGAWGLLFWVREAPRNEEVFRAQMWTKILPTRTQIETREKALDDGGDLREVERILSALKSSADVSPAPVNGKGTLNPVLAARMGSGDVDPEVPY